MSASFDIADPAKAAAILEQLTGFPHAVFCQHGTAALELALSVVAPQARTVAVPALGCWTVSHAASRAKRTPVFEDIGGCWSATNLEAADARISIAPWGAPAQRVNAPASSTTVADLTLAPGSKLDGEGPASFASAGAISFGGGKPLSLGGGGVALFREAEHAQRARSLFRFGFHDGQWQEHVERFSWSPLLNAPLITQLSALPSLERAAELAETRREALRRFGCESNSLPPGGTWGHEATLPVVLPADFPFTPAEVERIATCSGIRAVRHPVSPAYLEPAWDQDSLGSRCPNAEDLATSLLVLEQPDDHIENFGALIGTLSEHPSEFRFPFPLPKGSGALRAQLEELVGRAALVRDIRGSFGLFDKAGGVLWPVSEREAALLQERMLHA